MKEVSVFIASSVREFETERLQISPYLETLNGVYKRLDVQVKWNRPETQFGTLTMGGSQTTLDKYATECDLFALIVGERVGEHTIHEFEIALERFRRTKGQAPIILPCFMEGKLSPDSEAFLGRIRTLDIGAQYVDPYDNFDAVLTRLQMVLTNHVVSVMDMGDEEADLNRARERMIDKIRALRDEAKRLEAAPPSLENTAELTATYAEIARLVKDCKVEPDALLDCIGFLWKQHQYDMGINLGHWLESYYTIKNPSDDKQSELKNLLGLCYAGNKQYVQAEQYYQGALALLESKWHLEMENPERKSDVALTYNNLLELMYFTNRLDEAEQYGRKALTIYKQLAQANLDNYKSNLATIYNNLGGILRATARMEEAELYLREGIELNRQLAKENLSAYEPYVALSCNNLALLLEDTNRKEEAERYYREALEIYRRLAQANPNAYALYVGGILHNLAGLMYSTNRKEEAERYYREALEIYRRLAQTYSGAYDSNLAAVCNNLANLLKETKRKEEAERHYREALEIQRRLAQAYPYIYGPDLATACYNLGMLELQRTWNLGKYGIWGLLQGKARNRAAARPYFEEALSLYEKFPHLERDAQECRDILAKL